MKSNTDLTDAEFLIDHCNHLLSVDGTNGDFNELCIRLRAIAANIERLRKIENSVPPLTDAELTELERMEKAATAGPWQWMKSYEVGYKTDPEDEWDADAEPRHYTEKHWAISDPVSCAAGRVTDVRLVSRSCSEPRGGFGFLDSPNVQIVTALRNAAPRVLAELRRRRGESDASRWVPVGERLPESGQLVWGYHPNCKPDQGTVFRKGDSWFVPIDDEHSEPAVNPTHWQPLPPAPETGEKSNEGAARRTGER